MNDLIDLQLCSDGVKSAIADEDYEQAAAHLHRFLSMDEGKEADQCGFVHCIVIYGNGGTNSTQIICEHGNFKHH